MTKPKSIRVDCPKAAEPVGAYPHARKYGNLLFLSGVGPRARGKKEIPGVSLNAAGEVVDWDIELQARSMFENVRAILEESGSSWDRIIDVTIFLTDMKRDFRKYNEIYKEYFPNPETQPTRTTIEIGALPTPIAIEIKCLAEI